MISGPLATLATQFVTFDWLRQVPSLPSRPRAPATLVGFAFVHHSNSVPLPHLEEE